MSRYPNIEKSASELCDYIGRGPLGDYRIKRNGRRWEAKLVRTTSLCRAHGITGGSLRFISERIAAGGI